MPVALIALGGRALAAPNNDANAKFVEASKLSADGDNDEALTLANEGLAIAPRDLKLLELKGTLLLKARDFAGALAAYQAYIDAGAAGANRRAAQKIVASLQSVRSTFLEISSANTAATIYLDSKTFGTFCVAAPTCNKGILPGDYKVIAEADGFTRWTGHVSVSAKSTAKLAVALVEKSSMVTIHVAQLDAKIEIDGKPFDRTQPVPGGDHQLVVSLPGFATDREKLAVHAGAPVAVDVALVPLVPTTINIATAELAVDGASVVLDGGGLAVPPGAHLVTVRAAGYHEQKVEIPAVRGADYKLAVELVPIGAMLRVDNAPAGARITVDGKQVATTPLTEPVEVPAGSHVVELLADGFRPYRDHTSFTANGNVNLRIDHLRPDTHRRTYLVGGATVVAIGVGAMFSALAVSRESDFNDRAKLAGVTVDDPTLRSLKHSGDRDATIADVSLGLAVVGVAATSYFYMHEGHGDSEGSIKIGVGPGVAMVSGKF